MDFEERFRHALEHTKIHRQRQSNLFTFGSTRLPYVFAAESLINKGESVVRSGEIITEKPSIILQDHSAEFSGFGDEGEEKQMGLLFGRRFHLPAMKYMNQEGSLEVVSKGLDQVIEETSEKLDKEGNQRTAVISGPEDCWKFALIMYAGEMMQRSAPDNIREMFERNQFNSDDDSGFPGLQ